MKRNDRRHSEILYSISGWAVVAQRPEGWNLSRCAVPFPWLFHGTRGEKGYRSRVTI
jgi:hypothetical protein